MRVSRNETHARLIFGENLKSRRNSMGYSQVDFAKILGINQGELSQIENGVRGFSSDSLTEFSKSLGVEPWELLRPPAASAPSHRGKKQPTAARPPKVSRHDLSATVAEAPSASDVAAVLSRFLEAVPPRRALVLGLLFHDHSFVEPYRDELIGALQELQVPG